MNNSNHNFRKKLNIIIYNLARYLEIALSVVILVVIAITGIQLILSLTNTSLADMNSAFFSDFLSKALALIVGIEFINMLCKHSVQSVLEVLLFSIARQMVVEHLDTFQIFWGVLAIGVLFAVRKFFVTKEDEKLRHEYEIPNEQSEGEGSVK